MDVSMFGGRLKKENIADLEGNNDDELDIHPYDLRHPTAYALELLEIETEFQSHSSSYAGEGGFHLLQILNAREKQEPKAPAPYMLKFYKGLTFFTQLASIGLIGGTALILMGPAIM